MRLPKQLSFTFPKPIFKDGYLISPVVVKRDKSISNFGEAILQKVKHELADSGDRECLINAAIGKTSKLGLNFLPSFFKCVSLKLLELIKPAIIQKRYLDYLK